MEGTNPAALKTNREMSETKPAGFWKAFFDDVVEDDLTALAAAIAYYTTLSLAPLVLLALVLMGALYPSAQDRFISEVGALVGGDGQKVIAAIVDSASKRPDLRQMAGWIGAAVLVFSASAVFAQLQSALNRIWDMQNRAWSGWRGFLRRRVFSAGVLLAVLFLTIVSFLAQAAINLFGSSEALILKALLWSISFLLYAALFSMLYRWLPDGRVPWSTAFRGGMMTTLMFIIGRALIGLYLGHTDTAGAFGPAGALLAWLLWAFYSSLVFLLSAELLYNIARKRQWHWAAASAPPGASPIEQTPVR